MKDSDIKFVVFLIVANILIVLSFLAAWPFMWIWNYAVVAALSIAKPIGYWAAYWLMLLIVSIASVGARK